MRESRQAASKPGLHEVEGLWEGQSKVLELLARGGELEEVLCLLILVIEKQIPGMLGSVLLLDAEGQHLQHGSAPNLPEEYSQAVDGLEVGDEVGSCGTAVYRREPVIVEDIASDPLWAQFRELGLRHGLRACWSHPLFSADGQSLGTFAMYYQEPRRPEEEELELIAVAAHLAGIAIDNKRREDDRIQLLAKMQQVQKMESLGALAGGIAHDFNNLLVGVIGNADLAMAKLPPDSEIRHHLEEVTAAGERLADLANHMLAYSGGGQFVIESLDLSELLEDTASLIEASVSKQAEIEYELTRESLVKGDANQLTQVILNLVINGSEALLEDNGTVVLRVGVQDFERSYLAGTYIDDQLPAGSYVFLEVRDSGTGMDQETLAKIFDPFFTTKFTGRGLGLAAVVGIVRGHGGAIKIESQLGYGTTATVLLPQFGNPVFK